MNLRCTCGETAEVDDLSGAPVRCRRCGRVMEPARIPMSETTAAEAVQRRERRPFGSGFAVAAMLFGIASFVFGLLTSLVALLLGLVALVLLPRTWHPRRAAAAAVVGLVCAGFMTFLCESESVVLSPYIRPPYRHAPQCSDNLRNINIGVFQYANRFGGEMPPADRNICLLLGPEMGDATDKEMGGEHWRCPKDAFIPKARRPYWCSYAPNASVEETTEVIGTFSGNSALSNRIENIAPTTISFVEMWTPPNVVPGHPGFELKLDWRKPEDRDRSMVTPGKELCAIRSYRTPRPVKFDADGRLTDCGNYLFLRAFIGKRLEEMYHKGRINVAFIDGHCETMLIKNLVAKDRPIDNPMWTRDAD